jgi:hypothetical protein
MTHVFTAVPHQYFLLAVRAPWVVCAHRRTHPKRHLSHAVTSPRHQPPVFRCQHRDQSPAGGSPQGAGGREVLSPRLVGENLAATVGGLGPQGELLVVGVTPVHLGQPDRPDQPGPVSDRSPVGHRPRCRGDHAFRGADGIRAVVEERPLAQAPRGTKPRTVRRLLLFTSTRARRQWRRGGCTPISWPRCVLWRSRSPPRSSKERDEPADDRPALRPDLGS